MTSPAHAGISSPRNPRSVFFTTVLLSATVLVLWQFPRYWYTRVSASYGLFWLAEQTKVDGWDYRGTEVSKSVEKVLLADRVVSGEFKRKGAKVVRVFSAKRYSETQNEIGLFVHTPDRCWTESGWRMEAVGPDSREIEIQGIRIVFERRIFSNGTERELVYFGGLVGAQPLPYRLDHNLSVGMKHARMFAGDRTGSAVRASDNRFWRRLVDSFWARRPLMGPKQFVRVSTPVGTGELDGADPFLRDFLTAWLKPVDYQFELKSWKLIQRHVNH